MSDSEKDKTSKVATVTGENTGASEMQGHRIPENVTAFPTAEMEAMPTGEINATDLEEMSPMMDASVVAMSTALGEGFHSEIGLMPGEQAFEVSSGAMPGEEEFGASGMEFMQEEMMGLNSSTSKATMPGEQVLSQKNQIELPGTWKLTFTQVSL